MKKVEGILIIFLMVGLVVASGCMGGGGSETSSSSQTTSTTSSYSTTQSSMTTTSSSTTSSTHSTTTSTTGPTSTSSSSTQTSTSTTTTTTSPAEELYWSNPWEYSTVSINGEQYKVVYYKALYKVQPNQTSPIYEYIIEKSVEKTKIHIYGTDAMGNKKDLGEKEVYQYTTVVTPIKAAEMKDKTTIKVWYKNESGESFLYPWEMGWGSNMYGSSTDFVGFQIEYMGEKFTFTNPMAYGESLFPYIGGNDAVLDNIGTDLTNLWMGWFTVIQVGIWSSWSDTNLAIPESGTWTDAMGHTWSWSTKPDGTVTFSGVTLKVVDAQWSYKGAPEGTSFKGKARVAPKLFLPLEVEGHFSYIDQTTGGTTTIYGYIKIEDLKLEKVR
ncbi:hypothetical protein [Thermococcus sp.]